MNRDAIGAVGEVIGAVAVVLTIGYLAKQTKENTKQLRTESYRALFTDYRSTISELRANLFDLWPQISPVLDDWESAPAKNQALTHLFLIELFLRQSTAFRLWEQGAIDRDAYLIYENFNIGFLGYKGALHWWRFTAPSCLEAALYDRVEQRRQSEPISLNDGFSFYDARHWVEE